MKNFLWYGVLCILLLVSCTDNDIFYSDASVAGTTSADKNHKGMVHVGASGVVVTLGSDENRVPVKERPSMKVLLTYDFSIGVHEEMDDDSLPLVNVTYYDAILYANKRSKKEGYDTAYVYSEASFDSEKNCVSLRGLKFKPEVDAYRLPTETEWMLVAKQGWSPDSAWNSLNSDFKPHKVCTADLNKMKVCDMAGNVKEWVNDWMGNFIGDTTLVNFVGNIAGGSVGERVLKGGSFRNSPKSIKMYSRGDVYTVTSSMKAEYVGFRLAFGKISDPVWVSESGKFTESLIDVKATTEKVHKHTGTNNVRVAYRNDVSGNLAFIDYRWNSIYSAEVLDTLDVYHPEISPNGEWVAYCTNMEGVNGKSSIYVQKLNVYGTNRVQLNSKAAAIPRWKVLDSGDTVIVYVSNPGTNKDESIWAGYSTWQVSFSGGKFGTPEKLMDGSFHGGISDDGKLAVTGSSLLRARMADSGSTVFENFSDSVWYNGEQACNVSLSPDNSKKTMFLDFGSTSGKAFVGSSYRTHERLLIADSTGKLIQSVASSKGYSFDHVEWASRGSNLAVATLTNSDGAHSKVVLVDLRDSSITDLVEGDEIWHPTLWTAEKCELPKGSSLEKDSAGHYVNDDNTNVVLSEKMSLFWKLKDSIEAVCLGNSRMRDGMNALGVTSAFTFNFANVPCDMHCIEYYFKNYVLNHCEKLKYIVVGLDLDLWNFTEENSDYKKNLKESKGFAYDENHEFWKDGLDSHFVKMVDDAIVIDDDFSKFVSYRGWLPQNTIAGWGGVSGDDVEILVDSTWSNVSTGYKSNIEALKQIISLASENDVVVVGVIFPISPLYAETGAYGRHGMRRSCAKDILTQLNMFAKKFKNFVILDENKFGEHDYTDNMALDFDHLNINGARQLTYRLDSLLNTLK